MGLSYNFKLVCVDEATSTNQVLFRAPFSEFPFGTALLAGRQTAGRGRSERLWVSAEGGMYLSVLFLPRSAEGLTLLGALCVIRMCREDLGLPVQLRWPNDIYFQGKKLSGVLPQVKYHGQKMERAVLGVGLNVNQSPDVFPEDIAATTLSELCPGRTFQVEEVAGRYLELLAQELERFEVDGCRMLARRCEEYLEGVGRSVGVSTPDGVSELGSVAGLGSGGELLLADGSVLGQLGVNERLVMLA